MNQIPTARLTTLVLMSALFLAATYRDRGQQLEPPPGGFPVPKIELKGKLAKIFSVCACQRISGLTCRIRYNGTAPLPSKVFFIEFDEHGKKAATRMQLIYPKLKAGETGGATFRIRLAEPTKIVLEGEWKGRWQDPY